jgi:hypothetical protein
MSEKQIINQIREELDSLKKNGHEAVSIELLSKYLDDLSTQVKSSQEMVLAQYNAQHQSNIEEYKENRAEWRELLKALVVHAQAAIKLQAIINGGAAVALLAFIGKIWTPEFSNSFIGNHISMALILYCCGIGLSAVTQSLTYLSQHFYNYSRDKVGDIIRFSAQVTAFSSLALFFIASYIAYRGFMGGTTP